MQPCSYYLKNTTSQSAGLFKKTQACTAKQRLSCKTIAFTIRDLLMPRHKMLTLPHLHPILSNRFFIFPRFLFILTTVFKIHCIFSQILQKTCCFSAKSIYNSKYGHWSDKLCRSCPPIRKEFKKKTIL